MLLPKQVVTRKQLLKEGYSIKEITSMLVSLKLFPTPFKEIYYIPTAEERKSSIIDEPRIVLKKSVALYLGTSDFYFTCQTAEEFFGIKWSPSGQVHIVNSKLSRRIHLWKKLRAKQNNGSYRNKRIVKIISLFGISFFFHRVSSSWIQSAKVKVTPYGTYALRSQIRKDKKRFREKD